AASHRRPTRRSSRRSRLRRSFPPRATRASARLSLIVGPLMSTRHVAFAAVVRGILLLELIAPPGYHFITDGGDADTAYKMGYFIENGYGHFDSRTSVTATWQGKTYYALPSPFGNPTIIVYEVTSPEDIALIESLARSALKSTPKAKSITLQFFEKQ